MDPPEVKIGAQAVMAAMARVCDALKAQQETLTRLDQAMGDGDLGITATKMASALRDYLKTDPGDDLGKWILGAGMAINKAASSTMGTLLATALMRAGKEARGMAELTPQVLAAMLTAADQGVMERGKAKLGDKTLVDALHPAAEAFATAVEEGWVAIINLLAAAGTTVSSPDSIGLSVPETASRFALPTR